MNNTELNVIGDDLTGIIDDIRRLENNEEVRVIWKAVKNQYDKNLKREISKFQVFDRVKCQFRDHITKKNVWYDATVIKINTKTIKVELTDDFKGEQYNVDPKYLIRY